MTRLTIAKDTNSSWTYSREVSDSGVKINLTGSANASTVVPADKRTAVFSYSPGSTIDVGVNQVPAAYTGSFISAPDQEQLPTVLDVTPGDTLNFLNATTDAALIKVSFYKT